MRQVCTSTGGEAYEIITRGSPRKEDILRVFLDIFVRIAPPTLSLLTDGNGRFALHRSNRSFIALDPRGNQLEVIEPMGRPLAASQGKPFRVRDMGFREWNVVVCERPTKPDIEASWESTNWVVVSKGARQPVTGAHGARLSGQGQGKGTAPEASA